MASLKQSVIKKPQSSVYNFKYDELQKLKKWGSLHPGHERNLRVFWPLYLESHTNNVHVFNFTLVYNPDTPETYYNKLYFKDHLSPFSLQFAKKNLGKKILEKRFIYIVLVINRPDRLMAHANGLLYDTNTQNLERFEPHGSENPLTYTKISGPTSSLIKKFLEKNLSLKIKRFYQPKTTCPRKGWQTIQGNPRIANFVFNNKHKIGGYCAAWSLYFIILRAYNPNIPSKKLQESVFKLYETTSDYIHDFYYDFLRWKLELMKTLK